MSPNEIYSPLLNNPNLGDYDPPPGKELELLTDLQSKKMSELEERKALAQKLGLINIVQDIEKTEITLKESNRINEVIALNQEHKKIWEAWLPCKAGPWSENVPNEVMKKWITWREAKRFHSYEIWSNDRQDYCEEALIGVLNNRYYLLARWSKNDDLLLSIDSIIPKLRKWTKDNWFGLGGFFALNLLGCFMAISSRIPVGAGSVFVTLFFIISLFILTPLCSERMRIRRAIKKFTSHSKIK